MSRSGAVVGGGRRPHIPPHSSAGSQGAWGDSGKGRGPRRGRALTSPLPSSRWALGWAHSLDVTGSGSGAFPRRMSD